MLSPLGPALREHRDVLRERDVSPGQCCLQWARLPRLLLCHLLSTKTNSSFSSLQSWAQTWFETTAAGAAGGRNRIVALRNDHTEVSFLQQRRLTFSDRPATTTSRGFLRRAQRPPSALCWPVSPCAALEGRRGLHQAVAAASLTFQRLFFGPLTFGSGAQLRSSSAFSSFLRRPSISRQRRGDGNRADDLLPFPPLRHLLNPPNHKTVGVTTATPNLPAVAPEPRGTPERHPFGFLPSGRAASGG